MAQPEKYVFVCLNQRPEGHPKGSCLDRGAAEVFNALDRQTGFNPQPAMSAIDFGEFRNFNAPRRIQVAARFFF